jgi:hypothetical protein
MVMVSIRNVEQNIEMYSCLKIMQRVNNIIIFLLVASHFAQHNTKEISDVVLLAAIFRP